MDHFQSLGLEVTPNLTKFKSKPKQPKLSKLYMLTPLTAVISKRFVKKKKKLTSSVCTKNVPSRREPSVMDYAVGMKNVDVVINKPHVNIFVPPSLKGILA